MHRLFATCFALVGGLLILTGCQQQPPKPELPAKPPAKAAEPADEAQPARKHARRAEQPAEKVELPKPPEPKAVPKVSLSEEIKATNRVKVGD